MGVCDHDMLLQGWKSTRFARVRGGLEHSKAKKVLKAVELIKACAEHYKTYRKLDEEKKDTSSKAYCLLHPALTSMHSAV
jgi:hypothetical protein